MDWMGSEPRLEMQNISTSYGDEVAVEDVDLKLDEGEIITLVGPTGCGKTTTLRIVAGLERPDSGEVRIDGKPVNGERFVPPEDRSVGLVFQDFALFPHMTVEGNVGFRVKDPGQVEYWLQMMGMEDQRHKKPGNLSGGQKQRAALARSLAHGPSLVLLDEPLSNLDASLREDLKWEIRSALKDVGVAAVWVTHDQKEALSVGDRVGVMKDGRIEQVGTPEECFQNPANRFVAEFLGEASFLRGVVSNDSAETPLGRVRVNVEGASGRVVDVLVRPDDLAMEAADDGNGQVAWERYEGATRLYGVDLRDGVRVKVRLYHEGHVGIGEGVEVSISANHSLTCFSSEETEMMKPIVKRG